MKLKILKPGFTLIELLVVFSLAAIFAVFTIPSYINFNRSQEVKQSGLFLKSKIRDSQNRSFNGEKNSSLCTTADILAGFMVKVTPGSNSFYTGGKCGSTEFNGENFKFPSANVTLSEILNAGANCSAVTLANGSLIINFRPIGKGLDFYDGDNGFALGDGLNITKVALKLSDANNNNYFVMVNSTGDIYDASACQ